ncbi:MAG: polyphosphate polymerase domain-containing protein [Epsilonproteobacteria bacterium]|nr:polyphosphate polymerase domain-containing protein [Campylobacterota bacterium]
MDLKVRRNELKYYVNNFDVEVLSNRLSNILKRDPYAKRREGYFIRSLYFDSFDDECLYEKQSGVFERQKYRMRIYDLDSDEVKFEIKNKLNNQIYKESAKISRDSAYRIIDGDYEELLKYNNEILNKIYVKFTSKLYKPKVIIDYVRDAYIFDFFNLRITFDKDLRSNNSDFDLFSKDLHTVPVILEGKQILEIKYEKILPSFIKAALLEGSYERQAISKYTLGRRFLKMSNWEDN